VSDDPFYKPNPTPAPARVAQPGEVFCEFLVGHNRYLIELRDHGTELGVETQIFKNEELLIARRFDPRLDASRPSRELAIQWAEEERRVLTG
jgi:hypothetical protein